MRSWRCSKLDKPTPQVLIEAFIVEANKDVSRELGVQWGGAYQLGGNKRGFITGRDNNALGQGVGTAVDPTTGNIINLPIEAASASSFGFIFQNIGNAIPTQFSYRPFRTRANSTSCPVHRSQPLTTRRL